MTIQLLLCGVLPPGLIQYCSKHSCVITVKLFSICLVSIHVVHPYSSIDTTAAWKKLRFILSVKSDFHMTDSLSIAYQKHYVIGVVHICNCLYRVYLFIICLDYGLRMSIDKMFLISSILNVSNQFYLKQFSFAWVHSLSKTFLFQAIQFSQTVLIQRIQFSISIDFVYTQLNVKTVLFQAIQFCISMQFTCQNSCYILICRIITTQ